MAVHAPVQLPATPSFVRRTLGMAAFWTVLVGGEVRAVGLASLAVLGIVVVATGLRAAVASILRRIRPSTPPHGDG
jgi:hypothetical protein